MDETCRNCDVTSAEVEAGLCDLCFRSMPMGVLVTPGTWEPAKEDK
jgi:hypothetical protein